jgi:hypothetical protein
MKNCIANKEEMRGLGRSEKEASAILQWLRYYQTFIPVDRVTWLWHISGFSPRGEMYV